MKARWELEEELAQELPETARAPGASQAFPLARRSLRHLSFSLPEDPLLLCQLPETLPDQAAYLTCRHDHQQFAPFIEHLL